MCVPNNEQKSVDFRQTICNDAKLNLTSFSLGGLRKTFLAARRRERKFCLFWVNDDDDEDDDGW